MDVLCVFLFKQGGPGEEEEEVAEEATEALEEPKPLGQLITAFSRSATIDSIEMLEKDFLYITYADIMGQVGLQCFSFVCISEWLMSACDQ